MRETPTLNAAVIGLGSWARTLVESVQGKSAKIRFTRAVTRTPSKARDFARKHGFPVDDNLRGMLSDSKVDAVVIATPHSQHLDQVRAAAKAGKHVFAEKPLTLARKDAKAAVAACQRAGVVLAVGHNRRFLPLVAELKRMVGAGMLGTILHVESNFSGPSGYRHADSTWRSSQDESPAGGMTGRGVHLTDLMIHLFGPIVEVDARSLRRALAIDMDDTTVMLLRFASGMTGYLGTLTATAEEWRFQVFGSQGWADMRGLRMLTVSLIGKAPETHTFPELDMERAALEAFADAVAGGPPFPVTPAQAIHNTAVLEAIVNSAKRGTLVKLNSSRQSTS
jgi:predicted dehydrogenase